MKVIKYLITLFQQILKQKCKNWRHELSQIELFFIKK